MRKSQKQEVLEFIESLHQAHREVKEALQKHNYDIAQNMLSECQEFAVTLGESIEKIEGEGHITVLCVEKYCEALFRAFKEITDGQINENRIYKNIKRQLLNVENSVKNDISVKMEIAFFPYKASMWDSLESVYLAAKEDPECEAYCVPIPYYDMNPDHSFGRVHYEGAEYPENIEIIDWETYNFEDRRPDVIYIHNPYDGYNLVTSVHPRFYSSNLKKYTDTLVYIPYYSTSGKMNDAQSLCPAYIYADYIVIQTSQFRAYFDVNIPDRKFLPLGSPKFDRIINLCKNSSKPPEGWLRKMKGRKVYFYNTSISGMLENTDVFLKKMQYVFDIFKKREDVCLLWRPHPLTESTFDAMRQEYKQRYLMLKKRFVEEEIGILDETHDIEKTIALCDAYIGDSATSVTSLFGVVGKPLFILNNYLDTLPQEDDWRGAWVNPQTYEYGDDRYYVSPYNQLWFSENNDYHYKFYMNLVDGYSGGGYYSRAVALQDRIYVIPCNAQHLLVIKDKKIRKISFPEKLKKQGAFLGGGYIEKYIFIYPNQYPFLIRFDTETEEIKYIDGIQQFNVRNVQGKWLFGGIGQYGKELVFASPVDNQFMFMDINTLEIRVLSSNSKCNLGTRGIILNGDELWLMPLNGITITCWNPGTGDCREYNDIPENFRSIQWPYECECEEKPFENIVFSKEGEKETIVIAPNWGNMYISLDRETGKMEEWKPPITFKMRGKNGYFATSGMGWFVTTFQQLEKSNCRIWYASERKLYDINIETKAYKEVEIEFDHEDLLRYEPGFMEESEWTQYCLKESAFNSLKDFLDGNITGNLFDRERQIESFSKVNANTDGTCGKNIHNFVKGKTT